MSPKKITRLALIVAAISVVGIVAMAIVRPVWGPLNWWPAIGLGLAVLLLMVSFLWGAYLTAQKQVEMMDKLNDCYTGVPASSDEAMRR
ncbi:MAG: hypothetical protein HYR94_15310 [Chloroflexi bacterium]|nr:hypothetical protein [Chloroflexota bacterium]